jgi:hypothetical protein
MVTMSTGRPLGVWWARTAAAAGSRMCEDATHPVYRRLHQRAKQADALAAAAARTANKTHGRHFDGES